MTTTVYSPELAGLRAAVEAVKAKTADEISKFKVILGQYYAIHERDGVSPSEFMDYLKRKAPEAALPYEAIVVYMDENTSNCRQDVLSEYPDVNEDELDQLLDDISDAFAPWFS